MTALRKRRARRSLLCVALVGVVGCGGDDFENEPRAPTPLELTGVIQDKAVSVQPDRAGAGPFEITITNQTDEAQTVTLQGASVTTTRVGPVQPRDNATIQKTLPQGSYEVRAGSDERGTVVSTIRPAELVVGPPRKASGRDVGLP
jgi:hypothetical protein